MDNPLRTLRRTWAFNQEGVARLLGYQDRGPIAHYESQGRELSLRNAIGYSALFGVPMTDLVPDMTADVMATLRREATLMLLDLALDQSAGARRKGELLTKALSR